MHPRKQNRLDYAVSAPARGRIHLQLSFEIAIQALEPCTRQEMWGLTCKQERIVVDDLLASVRSLDSVGART